MSRGSSLLEIKLRSEAKEADEVARQERRRNVLVLILDHLSRNGYFESVQKLQQESGVSLGRFQVADNIDLVTIVQDYESFCQMKFGRLPRFVRAGTGSEEMSAPSSSNGAAARRKKQAATAGNVVSSTAPSGAARPAGDSNFPPIMPTALVGRVDQSSFASGGQYGSDSPAPPQTNSNANNSTQVDSARKLKAKGRSNDSISGTASPASNENATESVSAAKRGAKPKNPSPIADNVLDAVNISGTQIATNSSASIANGAEAKVKRAQTQRTVLSTTPASPPPASDPASPASPPADAANDDFFSRRVLKPLPDWTGEYRELAAVISRDIYLRNPNVRWDDIVELHEAKQLLKEAIVMPMRYPQLFSGLLSPWKGVLLYGPPGTGKTMLAKAVATECRTTFFNISASSIVSKWRGDSEKLVRTLFELARYHAPSTIFIDEMDSIMGTRDQGAGGAGEHEGSRRMKTELLIQMDGLSQSTDMVFVLAASNLPWDLDQAMLRRLEKRILVPLPEKKAREHLFRTHLAPGARASGLEYDQLADRTANYSGADLVLVCKEAAMRPVRRVMSQLAAIETGVSFAGAPPVQIAMHADASSGRQGPPGSGQEVVTLEPVTMADVDAALKCIKPSTTASSLKKYSEWHSAHGAGYSTVE